MLISTTAKPASQKFWRMKSIVVEFGFGKKNGICAGFEPSTESMQKPMIKGLVKLNTAAPTMQSMAAM